MLRDLNFTDANEEMIGTFISEFVRKSKNLVGREIAIEMFDACFGRGNLAELRADQIKSVQLRSIATRLGLELEYQDFLHYCLNNWVTDFLEADKTDAQPHDLVVVGYYIRVARFFNDRRTLENFYKYLREGRWYDLPTELLVEAIKLAYEFDDKPFLKNLYGRYLRESHRVGLPSELIAEVIKLASEFDDREALENLYRRYLRKYLRKSRRDGLPGGLIVAASRLAYEFDDELIVAAIKLAYEFDDRDVLREFYRDYGNRKADYYNVPLNLYFEIMSLALEFDNQKAVKHLYDRIRRKLNVEVGAIPLKHLDTVKRSALIAGDTKMLDHVQDLTASYNTTSEKASLED